MIDVRAAIANELAKVRLEVLVFGPEIEPVSADRYTASLQRKRAEIRDRLEQAGHNVSFGEDVCDPSLSPPFANPILQETAAMRAADLIVVLVFSPGTLVEATQIIKEPALCGKAHFFCFKEHEDGIVVKHVTYATSVGARLDLIHLEDVEACKLTTLVLTKAEQVHAYKTFMN